jgi:glycosyltransferase involved in cell wall biosynthesis
MIQVLTKRLVSSERAMDRRRPNLPRRENMVAPLRVMQIVSGTGVNGAVIHCLRLARALATRGHTVTLVCRPDSWISHQPLDGVEVFQSTLARWPMSELRRVNKAARERKIDVVQTHMSSAHFFGVLLRMYGRLPCVATAQSRHAQLHWSFNSRVIAVSEATARYHRRVNLVPSRKMEVAYNFIDDQDFSSVAASIRGAMRAQFGLEKHHLAIGTVGDIIPRKGQLDLVRAMPRILKTEANAKLLLIGWDCGEYATDIRREAKNLGVENSVIFCGHRADVRNVLSALDIYTLASREESFPLSTIEAMAGGLPVVSTTAGGLSECVVDGETGLLVDPGDVPALGNSLSVLAAYPELRNEVGTAGKLRAQSLFSCAAQTPRIEIALARACGRAA